MSALIRLKHSPLKLGILLALAAWLMQLSVFLTPIFAKQIGVGFGVCEELAVFSPFKPTLTTSSSSHSSSHVAPHDDEMSGMSMADQPHKMALQNPHSAHSSSHQVNSSQHHLSPETTTSSNVSASKVVAPSLLQPQAEPHHKNHPQCSFCLLLGHSVLPPLHVAIAVLLPVAISKIMVQAKAADDAFLKQNKNLRPQGRAPPVFIS